MPDIAAALATAKQALRSCTDSHDLEAQLLLAAVLDCDRTHLIAHAEDRLASAQLEQLQNLLARRCRGEPLAYILGWREFYGLRLSVNDAVLIPRPETELLVDLALEHLPQQLAAAPRQPPPATVLDLGTGSGAIAISIARHRPDVQVMATDLSTTALQLARMNAASHALENISFHAGSWYDALPETCAKIDMIISNPPYVAAQDVHLLQGDCRHEPSMALTPGDDDLACYRSIITGATDYLLSGGLLLLEHGHDQRQRLLALLQETCWESVQCHDDISGIARVIMAKYNPDHSR